ncbi:hypothetical protein KBI23_23355 [bacterium]|nr:hypothetical protein [bacterium]MBP9809765.1 hypothetical protein [bacterium]
MHDTDEASFEITEALVESMAASRDTVIMLLAPRLLLTKGMLNSAAQSALSTNITSKANPFLGIYCEQLVCTGAVSKQFGNVQWVVGKEKIYWLSLEPHVNDAAASAVNRLFDAIERVLDARQSA